MVYCATVTPTRSFALQKKRIIYDFNNHLTYFSLHKSNHRFGNKYDSSSSLHLADQNNRFNSGSDSNIKTLQLRQICFLNIINISSKNNSTFHCGSGANWTLKL